MSNLGLWALSIGILKLGASLFAALRPRRAGDMLRAFPRSVWPARILSTVDLVWAALLLNEMPMGAFDSWKVALYVLCPLAIILVPIYLDELLAPRALGGLYLLIAAPILDAARWHAASLSVLMAFAAYILVLCGVAFILSPYLFNRLVALWTRNSTVYRASALTGIFVGAALIALGVFVY